MLCWGNDSRRSYESYNGRTLMPTFKYKARDAESKNIIGKIEADSKNIVVEELLRLVE